MAEGSLFLGPLALVLARGAFDGLGLVAHWDPLARSFDPACYAFPLPLEESGQCFVNFALTSPRDVEVVVDGVAQLVARQPVGQGVLVLNQQAEGRENAIAVLFRTAAIQLRLSEWEANCRRSLESTEDADWYCGKRHQYRTHVMARVVLEPEHIKSLPKPGEVAQITRPVTDRGDRSQATNISSKGYGGPYLVANTSLVQGLWDWYRESRTVRAFPGDAITSGGYFGIASLLRSDVWILEVPDELRLPLVQACRAVAAEWAGQDPERLEPFYAGHHARIYRRGSSCPMHIDRRPAGIETVSCVYHLGALSGTAGGHPEWPMELESHAGGVHKLVFRARGELVVYEASVVPHGRPAALSAASEYVNVFVHLMPKAGGLAGARPAPQPRVPPGTSGAAASSHGHSRSRYVASCLEELWLDKLRGRGAAASACKPSFPEASGRWLNGSSALSSSSKFDASMFSRWEDLEGKAVQWVEPLVGIDRRPHGSFSHHLMASRERLVLGLGGTLQASRSREVGRQRSRCVLLDVGAGPSFGSSLGWLLRRYEAASVRFDRIFAWEEQPWAFWDEVPPQYVPALTFFNTRLRSDLTDLPSNPVALLGRICTPVDFCVLKIRTAGSQRADDLLQQLLSSPAKVAVVDELLWHGGALGSGSTSVGSAPDVSWESIARLRTLRELGVRAHLWF